MGTKGLEDNKPHRARTWNQLLPRQVDNIYMHLTQSTMQAVQNKINDTMAKL